MQRQTCWSGRPGTLLLAAAKQLSTPRVMNSGDSSSWPCDAQDWSTVKTHVHCIHEAGDLASSALYKKLSFLDRLAHEPTCDTFSVT